MSNVTDDLVRRAVRVYADAIRPNTDRHDYIRAVLEYAAPELSGALDERLSPGDAVRYCGIMEMLERGPREARADVLARSNLLTPRRVICVSTPVSEDAPYPWPIDASVSDECESGAPMTAATADCNCDPRHVGHERGCLWWEPPQPEAICAACGQVPSSGPCRES